MKLIIQELRMLNFQELESTNNYTSQQDNAKYHQRNNRWYQ